MEYIPNNTNTIPVVNTLSKYVFNTYHCDQNISQYIQQYIPIRIEDSKHANMPHKLFRSASLHRIQCWPC